jgi:cyclopropane-fatty-acyl-phospholipid synthase
MTDPVFALEPDVPRNVRLARWLLFRLLSGLREGSLTVREGAQTFHFGDPAAALRAEARVCTPEVYWRLLTGGSLAAAEAWMDGDWESHQLTALLQILARNGEVLGRLERGFRLLGKPVARLRHWTRRNTRAQARENIAAHYDLGNEFYAHFLDDDLLYSSALFTDDEQDLTQAQRAKMARLCDQLALTPAIICWRLAPAGGAGRIRRPPLRLPGHHHHPFGSSTAGLPSAWPAPGCRIASRCCSATTAICAASTTNWCRWR